MDKAWQMWYHVRMNTKLSEEQLDTVKMWAAAGTDLNGIQKKLQQEFNLHLTYMEVRFLLLDHGIELTSDTQPAASDHAASPFDEPQLPKSDGLRVEIDDLQLPGTLVSGKVYFPSGTQGSWQVDELGRLTWSSLTGKPTDNELRLFQQKLSSIL